MEAFPANPIHGNISLEKHSMEGLFDPGPGISASLIFTPCIALPMKIFHVYSHNRLWGIHLVKNSQKNLKFKAIYRPNEM